MSCAHKNIKINGEHAIIILPQTVSPPVPEDAEITQKLLIKNIEFLVIFAHSLTALFSVIFARFSPSARCRGQRKCIMHKTTQN